MYPNKTQDSNFRENKYIAFYRDTVDYILKEQGSCGLTSTQYRDLYPMFALDVTAQEASPANHPVNILTVIERNSPTPANVEIYLLILYEKHIKIYMTKNSVIKSS